MIRKTAQLNHAMFALLFASLAFELQNASVLKQHEYSPDIKKELTDETSFARNEEKSRSPALDKQNFKFFPTVVLTPISADSKMKKEFEEVFQPNTFFGGDMFAQFCAYFPIVKRIEVKMNISKIKELIKPVDAKIKITKIEKIEPGTAQELVITNPLEVTLKIHDFKINGESVFKNRVEITRDQQPFFIMVVAIKTRKSAIQVILGSLSSETTETMGIYQGGGELAVWTVANNYYAVLVHEVLHFLGNGHTIGSSFSKYQHTAYIDNADGSSFIMAPAHQQIGFNWKGNVIKVRNGDFYRITKLLGITPEEYQCPAPLIVKAETFTETFTPEQQLFIKHGRQVDPRDLNLSAIPEKLGLALKIVKFAEVAFYTVVLSLIVFGWIFVCCSADDENSE